MVDRMILICYQLRSSSIRTDRTYIYMHIITVFWIVCLRPPQGLLQVCWIPGPNGVTRCGGRAVRQKGIGVSHFWQTHFVFRKWRMIESTGSMEIRFNVAKVVKTSCTKSLTSAILRVFSNPSWLQTATKTAIKFLTVSRGFTQSVAIHGNTG